VNNILGHNNNTIHKCLAVTLGQPSHQSSRGDLAPFSTPLHTLICKRARHVEWGTNFQAIYRPERFRRSKTCHEHHHHKQPHHPQHQTHPHIIKMEYNTGAPAPGPMTGGRACYNCENALPPTAPRRSTSARTMQSLCRPLQSPLARADRAEYAHEPLSTTMRPRFTSCCRTITDHFTHRRRPLSPGPRVPLQGYPHLLQLRQPGPPFPRVH
jgi:hypothetical protein